jgi:hypothetical protein
MFEIEQGVPIPQSKRGRKPKKFDDYDIPIHQMKVNDSVCTNNIYNIKNASKWRSKIIYLQKKMKNSGILEEKQFLVKEYEGKVRIWRVL